MRALRFALDLRPALPLLLNVSPLAPLPLIEYSPPPSRITGIAQRERAECHRFVEGDRQGGAGGGR